MKYGWVLTILIFALGCQSSEQAEDARIAKMAESLPPHRASMLDASEEGIRPIVETRIVPASAYRPAWEVLSKREWDMETATVDSLGRIGEASVPHMIQALHSRDPRLRLRATRVLARIGPDASDAVPVLTRALEDPEADVRKGAVLALGQIGPSAADAVEPLVRVLNESE